MRRPSPQDTSALGTAAAALEAELRRFEGVVAEVRVPRLHTAKNLDRGAQTLTTAAESQERLGLRIGELIAAIQQANARQAVAAEALAVFSVLLHERQVAYAGILEQVRAFGQDAAALQARLEEGPERLDAVREGLTALIGRAQELKDLAESHDFRDVGSEAAGRLEQLGALLGRLGPVH